jgi:hypothetical protein
VGAPPGRHDDRPKPSEGVYREFYEFSKSRSDGKHFSKNARTSLHCSQQTCGQASQQARAHTDPDGSALTSDRPAVHVEWTCRVQARAERSQAFTTPGSEQRAASQGRRCGKDSWPNSGTPQPRGSSRSGNWLVMSGGLFAGPARRAGMLPDGGEPSGQHPFPQLVPHCMYHSSTLPPEQSSTLTSGLWFADRHISGDAESSRYHKLMNIVRWVSLL